MVRACRQLCMCPPLTAQIVPMIQTDFRAVALLLILNAALLILLLSPYQFILLVPPTRDAGAILDPQCWPISHMLWSCPVDQIDFHSIGALSILNVALLNITLWSLFKSLSAPSILNAAILSSKGIHRCSPCHDMANCVFIDIKVDTMFVWPRVVSV